jgi:hypothetical protein
VLLPCSWRELRAGSGNLLGRGEIDQQVAFMRSYWRKSACFAGFLLLGGCGTDIPIEGQTSDGERFSGALTTRGRDYGPLEMRNEGGISCNGTWQIDPDRKGATFLRCSDGRTGTAELSAEGSGGVMKGMLGGERFRGTVERLPGS